MQKNKFTKFIDYLKGNTKVSNLEDPEIHNRITEHYDKIEEKEGTFNWDDPKNIQEMERLNEIYKKIDAEGLNLNPLTQEKRNKLKEYMKEIKKSD